MSTTFTPPVAVVVYTHGVWQCYKHPRYKVKRAPTSDCKACQLLWLAKENTK